MVDCIYPVQNRYFYTVMTFPRVLDECMQTGARLYIYDDNSTDGSSEFIQDCLVRSGYNKFYYTRQEIGNSTFCINKTLDLGANEYIYKVDNDILIPEGSFEHMIKYMPEDGGFMMMHEWDDFPFLEKMNVKTERRSHIGGVGLFRRRAFGRNKIKSSGKFFGFTEFQIKNSWKKFVINSANTNLDMMRCYNRSYDYEKKGYGRNLCKAESIFQKN